MKIKRLRFSILLVLALVIFLVFFTDLVGVAGFLPKVRFTRSTSRASSTVTLEAVRDIYAFNTVQYVHRAVFPYDYLAEDLDLNRILTKIRNGGTTVAESLGPDEHLYFRAFSLAQEVGMDPRSGRDFLVVTIIVTAGFNLEDSALASSSSVTDLNETEGAFRTESYEVDGQTRRRIFIPAPTAIVTDIVVEDIVPEDYTYPDVSMSADDWRRVAQFVRTQVADLPEIDDLLDVAEANGEEFVREVLERSGFDDVVFESGR